MSDFESSEYLKLPIDPREAANLELHVVNCVKRHSALVDLIHKSERRQTKNNIITWIYRSITIPLLVFIAVQFFQIQKAMIQAAMVAN